MERDITNCKEQSVAMQLLQDEQGEVFERHWCKKHCNKIIRQFK